jgi:transposase-like protein
MKKIAKREYTAEFKELAVKRVKSGQTAGAVARDLGLTDQTLRNWVKAAAAGKLNASTRPDRAPCQEATTQTPAVANRSARCRTRRNPEKTGAQSA